MFFLCFVFLLLLHFFLPGPVGPGAAAGGRLLLRGAPEAGAPDPSLRGEATRGMSVDPHINFGHQRTKTKEHGLVMGTLAHFAWKEGL